MKLQLVKRRLKAIVCAALIMGGISACESEPDVDDDPVLPLELQNTQWIDNTGNRVIFGVRAVIAAPVSGVERTFILKNILIVSGDSQTTLCFGDSQTENCIIYRNGTIVAVNLGAVQTTGAWQQDADTENNDTDTDDDDRDETIAIQLDHTGRNPATTVPGLYVGSNTTAVMSPIVGNV